jgi:lipopolysaccharide export system protein LptA
MKKTSHNKLIHQNRSLVLSGLVFLCSFFSSYFKAQSLSADNGAVITIQGDAFMSSTDDNFNQQLSAQDNIKLSKEGDVLVATEVQLPQQEEILAPEESRKALAESKPSIKLNKDIKLAKFETKPNPQNYQPTKARTTACFELQKKNAVAAMHQHEISKSSIRVAFLIDFNSFLFYNSTATAYHASYFGMGQDLALAIRPPPAV